MVGLIPLKDVILVRIQVSQPTRAFRMIINNFNLHVLHNHNNSVISIGLLC